MSLSLLGYSLIFSMENSKAFSIPLSSAIVYIFVLKRPISSSVISSLKDNNVFISTFKNLPIIGNNVTSGWVTPFSHLFTAGVDTFRCFAKSSCVNPNPTLLFLIISLIFIWHLQYEIAIS